MPQKAKMVYSKNQRADMNSANPAMSKLQDNPLRKIRAVLSDGVQY